MDAEAFAALYRQHRTPLFHFCLARTDDPTVAEDIVQDVFERAFAMRARYDPARPFWPWIAAIAARQCIDSHRRRTSAVTRVERVAAASPTTPVDTTATTVLSEMSRSDIERRILSLPERQRVAVQLFALDAWTQADIAAYLGVSVAAVKALIVRARATLRDTMAGCLAGVCAVARTVRTRARNMAAWGQAAISNGLDPFASWTHALLSHTAFAGVVALAMAGGVAPSTSPPVPGAETTPWSWRTAVPPSAETDPGAAPAPPAAQAPPVVAEEPPTRPVAGAAERAAHDALAPVLPSTATNDEPDTIQGADIAVSPGYEEDHTIFVVGSSSSSSTVGRTPLLVSRDGGASWHRAAASGLDVTVKLLLPPAYPVDNRLFAVTRSGLQVSRDGGEHFETLVALPSTTDAAISPAFNRGDPSILVVAGARLFEFRADTERVQPLVLGDEHAAELVTSAAFASGYPADPTIVVGSRVVSLYELRLRARTCTRVGGADPLAAGTFHCSYSDLPSPRSSVLELHVADGSRPGTVWGLNVDGVYRSGDGGRTFRHTRPSWTATWSPGQWDYASVHDLAVLPSPGGESVVIVQESSWSRGGLVRPGPPLLRTDDGGQTWAPMEINLRGWRSGLSVAVTPTGRIVAGGLAGGIACSADGGRSWGHTCPGPDAG